MSCSNPLNKNFDFKAAYEALQIKGYGIDPSTGNPVDPKANTKVGQDNSSSQDLFESARRISDIKDLAKGAIEVLTNDKAGKTKSKKALKFIEETIYPALDIASDIVRAGAKRASPIAQGEYAHAREEVRRKIEIAQSDPKCVPKVVLMNEFIQNGGSPDSSPEKLNSAPPSKPSHPAKRQSRARQVKHKLSKMGKKLPICVPKPSNGTEYGVGEFIQIVTKYPKGSHKRGGMIRMILEKEYVKKHQSTVREALRVHEVEGRQFAFDDEWNTVGRPPLLKDPDLAECANRFATYMGRKSGKDEINEFLREKERKNGGLPDKRKRWCDSTLSNYLALLTKRFNICLQAGSIPKTNARFTAENSLIGAMAQLIVVAMTHFYVVEMEDVEWREMIKDLDAEDMLLYNMVSHFHGDLPIRIRSPTHVVSCDDTTDYICEGLQTDKTSEIGLVARACLNSKGTDSVYHTDKSNRMNGRRVKHHCIGNAAGETAEACITMYVTDAEMPGDDDFQLMRVEGLSKSGSDSEVGWVLLMKPTQGAEKKRFQWIRKNILFPFIEKIRKKHNGWDPNSGIVPAGEEYTVVVWCDGDNSQLDTVVSEEGLDLYSQMNIIACKHNAAGTATGQPMDKSKIFPSQKRLNKTTTVQHVPAKFHDLKGSVLRELTKLSKSGTLRLKKQAAFVDYISKLPRIFAQSRHRDNVVHGFVEVGFVDSDTNIVPNFLKIIASRKKMPTQAEYSLCLVSFFDLMDYSYNNGMQYISDDVFIQQHNFPADNDMNGNEVIRTAGITQENRQRAKVLTGPDAKSQRDKLREEIEFSNQAKEARVQANVDRKQSEEKEMIKILCESAELDVSEDFANCDLTNCEMKHFDKLTSPKLQNFIIARHSSFKTKSSVSHLKKPRGTALADALNGVENLISVAYSVRKETSRLLAAAAPADEEANDAEDTDDSPRVINISLDPTRNDIKPSKLITDPQWLARLWSVLDPQDRFMKCVIDEELATKCDLLYVMLNNRLRLHIKRRAANHREHWCLEWARRNLSIVAAYMVLLNHVKKDISRISDSKCLLSKPTSGSSAAVNESPTDQSPSPHTRGYSAAANYLFCTNSEALLQGCYLYYDTNEEEWIRSGKVTGANRNFLVRHKEHLKKAGSDRNDDESIFYDAYPTMNSKRANNIAGEGFFENLRQYVGAGFMPTDDAKSLCWKNYNDGGLFFLTEEERQFINRVNFQGRSKEENILEMVGYLFELGYDLALSHKYNVSGSPGFEGCGLMFGRK